MTLELVLFLAFYAVGVFVTLYWALPTFFRWLLLPSEPPPPSDAPPGSLQYQMDELDRATDEARRQIGAALLPIVEDTMALLTRILKR
jgi:hypothetical protein